VLHSHDYKSTILGALATAWSGVRHVATLHGDTGESTAVKMYERALYAVLPALDGVATVSSELEQRVKRTAPRAKVAWIANGLDRISGLKKKLRGSQMPIVLGFPFGLTIETIPTHLPLPAKIRTELLEPIHVDHDPERVNDREYVESIYREVESAIQHAMNRLAAQRRFPIFG